MNKQKALKVVNPLLAMAFIGQILTVTVKALILEEGGSFMGLPGDAWMEAHEFLGFSLLTLASLHLILNWKWIVATLKGRTAS